MSMASPSREADPPKPASQRRRWWWPVMIGAAYGLVMRLLYSGDTPYEPYRAMTSSFALLVPIAVGCLTVYFVERNSKRSAAYHFGIAAAANALFVFGTYVTVMEGLICVVLAAPLFAFMGGIAGVAMGAICRWTQWPRRVVSCVAVLPLICAPIEQFIPAPDGLQTVEMSRIVNASPEKVWEQLLNAGDIAPDEMQSAVMYRIGTPLPLSARSETQGKVLVRHITMARGVQFDQISTSWEPGRRVLWTYRFRSDSFPAGSLDDHVRIGGEYFDLIDTEYLLTPTAAGSILHARMTYRVSTHFNWYVKPLTRFLVSNFEDTALGFYASRAEHAASRPDGP
jgi:hypothetical protein